MRHLIERNVASLPALKTGCLPARSTDDQHGLSVHRIWPCGCACEFVAWRPKRASALLVRAFDPAYWSEGSIRLTRQVVPVGRADVARHTASEPCTFDDCVFAARQPVSAVVR